MIESAADFVRLRTSEIPGEQYRAAHDAAAIGVWGAVIEKYPDMREWVARNKTVPVEILWELSRDPDSRVRVAVAMKRKLPEALQLVLAGDPDEGVRHRIACNAKATKRVLQILADDDQSFVRETAIGRLEEEDFVG
ncbi:MAG: HEAT repeat domain-containing protein [Planctomycetia bacterium]